MTYIMIFEEKHSNRHYIINNDEDKARVSLNVLRERSEEGYWYPKKEYVLERMQEDLVRASERFDKDIVNLTEEEIAALPEVFREKALKEQTMYLKKKQSVERYYQDEIEWSNLLEQLLKADEDEAVKMTWTSSRGREFNLAVFLLDSRADAQYEGYTLETALDY